MKGKLLMYFFQDTKSFLNSFNDEENHTEFARTGKQNAIQAEQNQGLFPYILNLATRATIEANATCRLAPPEYFCKLVEHVDLIPRISHCDHCNARKISQAHQITYAIDGSNLWLQSPSISNGGSSTEQNQGLFPYILNLATQVTIEANATCGLAPAEYFCKLVEHVDLMPRIFHCNAREISQAHQITDKNGS
ncbi:hypothetical protein DPMN_160766 [Dreissena polymorpha]|uniref:Laminin N-terminal domain-containing protein n=1 Tax=Dreissena polymorpha TaxID=45954 RepID=A0A9D4EQV4_DREPO|nr:hypothetical protein DPMN_160766 [Dreissena polymorpha]